MELTRIQWYPGHIAKAEKKLTQVINRVDLVVEEGNSLEIFKNPKHKVTKKLLESSLNIN